MFDSSSEPFKVFQNLPESSTVFLSPHIQRSRAVFSFYPKITGFWKLQLPGYNCPSPEFEVLNAEEVFFKRENFFNNGRRSDFLSSILTWTFPIILTVLVAFRCGRQGMSPVPPPPPACSNKGGKWPENIRRCASFTYCDNFKSRDAGISKEPSCKKATNEAKMIQKCQSVFVHTYFPNSFSFQNCLISPHYCSGHDDDDGDDDDDDDGDDDDDEQGGGRPQLISPSSSSPCSPLSSSSPRRASPQRTSSQTISSYTSTLHMVKVLIEVTLS